MTTYLCCHMSVALSLSLSLSLLLLLLNLSCISLLHAAPQAWSLVQSLALLACLPTWSDRITEFPGLPVTHSFYCCRQYYMTILLLDYYLTLGTSFVGIRYQNTKFSRSDPHTGEAVANISFFHCLNILYFNLSSLLKMPTFKNLPTIFCVDSHKEPL